MQMILRTRFWYKDGTSYEMATAIPNEVGDKIGVEGLVAVEVYVDAKVSNLPVVDLNKTAKLIDFKGG